MGNNYLIVIDMQHDFVDGTLGTPEAQAIVPKVAEKLKQRRKEGWNIIFTQDTHFDETYHLLNEGRHLPVKHCIHGTTGRQIVEEVLPRTGEHLLQKTTFGSLCWDTIMLELPERIEIVGLCTDICVVSNALILKALYPETEITVDASACAGTTPEMHRKALDVMKSCQIEIINEKN